MFIATDYSYRLTGFIQYTGAIETGKADLTSAG